MIGLDDKVVIVGYEEMTSIGAKPTLTYTLAEKPSVQVCNYSYYIEEKKQEHDMNYGLCRHLQVMTPIRWLSIAVM